MQTFIRKPFGNVKMLSPFVAQSLEKKKKKHQGPSVNIGYYFQSVKPGLPNRFLKKSDTGIIFQIRDVTPQPDISLFARSLPRLAKLACQLLLVVLD